MKAQLLLFLLTISSFSIGQTDSFNFLDSIARRYYNMGQYDSAKVYSSQLLKIKESTGEIMDTLYANSLVLHADIIYYKREFEKGINLYKKAEDIYKKILSKASNKYIFTHYNLSYFYSELGDYQEAANVCFEAFKLSEMHLGLEHQTTIEAGSILVTYYGYLGKLDESIEFIEELLKSVRVTEENEQKLALLNYKLGIVYSNKKNFQKSLNPYQKSLQYFSNLKEPNIYTGACFNGLGLAYGWIGDYDRAINYLHQADSLNNLLTLPNANLQSTIYNNLGMLYNYVDEADSALIYMRKSFLIDSIRIGVLNPKISTTMSNLGGAYLMNEEYVLAYEYLTKAIELKLKFYGKNSIDYAGSLDLLGSYHFNKREYDKSVELASEMVSTYEEILGKNSEVYVTKIIKLANAFSANQDYNKSNKLLYESIQKCPEVIFNSFEFLSNREREGYIKSWESNFNKYYHLLFKTKQKTDKNSGYLFNISLLNKGLLLRSSSAIRFQILNSKDSILIEQYESWLNVRKKIQKKYLLPIDKREGLDSLENISYDLEKKLISKSQTFSDYRNQLVKDWKFVQKSIGKSEVAIEFASYEKTKDSVLYFALILDNKMKYPKVVKLFWESELEKAFSSVSGSDFKQIEGLYEPSGILNKLILSPLEEYIKNYKTIYYSPIGLLNKVSFAALAGKKSHLCDQFNLYLVPSTSKIKEVENMDIRTVNNIAIFGGVDYGGSEKNEVWSFLPGTEKEAQEIEKLIENKKVKLNKFHGKRASEENFKKIAQESDILHISTHGFFFPDPVEIRKKIKTEKVDTVVFRGSISGLGTSYGSSIFVKNKNPLMRSGLTFAGANQVWNNLYPNNKEDGVLTASEVSNLNLTNTELVVLSACETGLGDIQGSEGVYGLQRAFKIAGTKKIVMSLWEVPDSETQEFMSLFYKHIFNGGNVNKAFQKAQSKMKREYDPYFWAAFVLLN